MVMYACNPNTREVSPRKNLVQLTNQLRHLCEPQVLVRDPNSKNKVSDSAKE